MTDNESLFVKYYNSEKVFIADKTVAVKQAHSEELEAIVYEAKTKLLAAKEDMREEKSKLSTNQRDWLKTKESPDALTSDAITAVTARKARMSKMDKLNEQLKAAGIDDETRKQMIRDLEAKMTEKTSKTISFKSAKPSVKTETTLIVQASSETEVPKVPFDPSSLKFGK